MSLSKYKPLPIFGQNRWKEGNTTLSPGQNRDHPLYLTTKGSLWLISRKTDLRIYTAQLIALHEAHGLDLKPIKNRELGKDGSLVVKFGSIHAQPRTRQALMPCDLHSIIYLASRFFCSILKANMDKQFTQTGKDNSWAQFMAVILATCDRSLTLTSAYKVDLNNGFRCIGRARWAHRGEPRFVKCFKILQLQTPRKSKYSTC